MRGRVSPTELEAGSPHRGDVPNIEKEVFTGKDVETHREPEGDTARHERTAEQVAAASLFGCVAAEAHTGPTLRTTKVQYRVWAPSFSFDDGAILHPLHGSCSHSACAFANGGVARGNSNFTAIVAGGGPYDWQSTDAGLDTSSLVVRGV